MKLLLTSCGLETPRITQTFLSLLPCPPQQARALFIPTAAITCDAIEVLPKCLEDLFRVGIDRTRITIHDLHSPLTLDYLAQFDCLYIAGGDTSYLASRIRNHASALLDLLAQGRAVVLGVSAGSMIFSASVPAGLNVLPNPLHVHCVKGTSDGPLPPPSQPIHLSNTQAIVFANDDGPFLFS